MAKQKSCATKNVQSITRIKEIDDEYRTILINFAKYHLIIFAMSKIMERKQDKRNRLALYLVNSIIKKCYY